MYNIQFEIANDFLFGCVSETAVLLLGKLLYGNVFAWTFDMHVFKSRLHMLQMLLEMHCDISIADGYSTDVKSYMTKAIAIAESRHYTNAKQKLGELFAQCTQNKCYCVC